MIINRAEICGLWRGLINESELCPSRSKSQAAREARPNREGSATRDGQRQDLNSVSGSFASVFNVGRRRRGCIRQRFARETAKPADPCV